MFCLRAFKVHIEHCFKLIYWHFGGKIVLMSVLSTSIRVKLFVPSISNAAKSIRDLCFLCYHGMYLTWCPCILSCIALNIHPFSSGVSDTHCVGLDTNNNIKNIDSAIKNATKRRCIAQRILLSFHFLY
jgi:hypothetical protein